MSVAKYLFRLSSGEYMYVGDYNNGNYLAIASDGTLSLVGDATAWEDLRVPVTSTKLGGSKDPDFAKVLDDGSGSQGVFAYLFSNTTEEEIYFDVQIPHSWKEGGTLYAHVHWSPTTAGAGGVTWGLEYSWSNIGAVFGNTTLATVDDTAAEAADTHQMTDAIEIDGTGKTHSSMMICRLYRDVADDNDTYAADVALLEFDFHFEVDAIADDSLP